MRFYNYLTALVLVVLSSCQIVAAELPKEVLAGWEVLRDKEQSYHTSLSSQQEGTGKKLSPIQVHSRLNRRYEKVETYFADATAPSSLEDIQRVLLYDGQDFFHLERKVRNSKLTMRYLGNHPLTKTISVGEQVGPSVGNVDLYDSAYGTGNFRIVEYHAPSQEDPLARIVVRPIEAADTTIESQQIWLDQNKNYRIAKTQQTVNLGDGNSTDGKYISEANYEYGDSEKMTLKIRTTTTKVGGRDGEKYPPLISTSQSLEPSVLPRNHFTLEHYGLPPYRRKSYAWTYALITVAVLVLIAFVYRRRAAVT